MAERVENQDELEDGANDEGDDNESQEDDDQANDLACTYETDAATGVTSITITGTYKTTITQGVDEKTGSVIYTSPDFKAPQQSLKSALEWVGRNIGTRTLRNEWDRQNNPLDGAATDAKTRKLMKKIKEAEDRASRFEQMAMQAQATSDQERTQMGMALSALMKRLEAMEAQPSSTEAGVSDAPTISASSASAPMASPDGSESPTAKARRNAS